MSEEVLQAAGDRAEIARLRRELAQAQELAEKQGATRQQEIEAAQRHYDLQEVRIEELYRRVGFLEASCAALRSALDEAIALCHVPERNQDDEWQERLSRASNALASGAGEAVEAELAAARAIVAALEAGIARDGYCAICHQTERVTLQTGYYTHHEGCALAAYQEARKGASNDRPDDAG